MSQHLCPRVTGFSLFQITLLLLVSLDAEGGDAVLEAPGYPTKRQSPF